MGVFSAQPLKSGERKTPRPANEYLAIFKKECAGALTVKEKLWFYEGRAHKALPPFSASFCRSIGVKPFTERDAKTS
jgi:hypothetical protein